jgi:YidC/Oxa1 family membrane protein insertase
MIPTNPSPDKKDVSMETRLLLAFLLTGLLLFLTQYFYKPEPVPPPKTASKPMAETAPAAPAQPAAQPAAQAAPIPAAAPIPGAIHADKEETFTVDTQLYRVVFSNKGGVVKSWILKNYKDNRGKPVELVNQKALEKVAAPFSILPKGQEPDKTPGGALNGALFQAIPAEGGMGIDYQFSDGHTVAKKSFRFQKDSYLSQVSSELDTNGVAVPHQLAWLGGFGDPTVASPEAAQHALYYDPAAVSWQPCALWGPCQLNAVPSSKLKKGPISAAGALSFAGLEDAFFAAVFIPRNDANVEITMFSDSVPTILSQKELPLVGAAVGSSGDNRFTLYAGPKDIEILKKLDPKLEPMVDWGASKIIAKPLFFALNWTNDHLVHNFGWAIIVVTIVINMLLLPLKFTSLKSARKMQELQPQIAAINDKYKNVGLRDPKKQQQNEEIMELYKKNGANPLGGCVPMILQIPFFIAFYKVLTVAIQLRGAHWLWVGDLSRFEDLPIRVLPVILIVTQFVSQRMTPTTAMDPAQQKMMMIMPLGMGYMFYFQPAGMVLYWLTGNLVGIVQQWLTNRVTGAPVAVKPAVKPGAPAKKKNTRN